MSVKCKTMRLIYLYWPTNNVIFERSMASVNMAVANPQRAACRPSVSMFARFKNKKNKTDIKYSFINKEKSKQNNGNNEVSVQFDLSCIYDLCAPKSATA